MGDEPKAPETVLVWAGGARDGVVTKELLSRIGVEATLCASVDELCARMTIDVAAAIVTEELLTRPVVARIVGTLAQQPAWSDFPFVLFRSRGDVEDPRDHPLGNVTIVDRPVHVRTMLAAVRAALRSRHRQWEARRAIDSRDQFLAMLGHELRNPLGAIVLAAELLARTKTEVLREKQRNVIERQSRHLARLVDDLLDVARVTYGKVVLHKEPLDLAEIVRSCIQANEPRARAAGLLLSFDADARPIPVLGDRLRLEQIVSNLVTNAVKYTQRGGTIHVDLRCVGERAVLRVIDSGIGIAPEMLPRIFDVFAQADRTLDRAQGGLGLGLTVVRSLVRSHDGEVEARSEGLGKGAELIVRLPLGATLPCTPVAPNVAPISARRVVIVEDNDDVRGLFELLLRDEGHEVWTASDGPTGHSLIVEKAPDVAFVDVGLPGFDGYEVARRVRARGVRSRLVAVTGYGQPEDRRRAVEAGFDQHLTKPVGREALEAALAAAPAEPPS